MSAGAGILASSALAGEEFDSLQTIAAISAPFYSKFIFPYYELSAIGNHVIGGGALNVTNLIQINGLSAPTYITSELIYSEKITALSSPFYSKLSHRETIFSFNDIPSIGNHVIGGGAPIEQNLFINAHSILNNNYATLIELEQTDLTGTVILNNNYGTVIEDEGLSCNATAILNNHSATLIEDEDLDFTAYTFPFYTSTIYAPIITFNHQLAVSAIGNHIIGGGVELSNNTPLNAISSPFFTDSLCIIYGRLTKVFYFRAQDEIDQYVFWKSFYTTDINPSITIPPKIGTLKNIVLLSTDIISC